MRKTAALSLLLIALTAAPAAAAPTAWVDGLSFTAAGCQAKGVFAVPVSTAGTLAAGTYRYQVTAVTAAGEVSPVCKPVVIANPASNTSVIVQWNRVAGATKYWIYRGSGGGALAALGSGGTPVDFS